VNLARAALGTLIGSAQIKSVRDDPGSLIEIGEFEDDETESIALARWLRERHAECGSWSSLAVLARTNARLMPVAEALERAGIPVIKRGQSVSPSENAVLALLKQMPPSTPLRSAFADLSAELEDLGWLADEIESICSDIPDADIGQLLAWRAAASFAERSGVDGVQLSTFHRAKGLEWRSVAVVGLEAGMVPISHATRSAALEEERRLLYVALTRAERDLWCSWARQRMVFGKSWSCDPSPYVAALRQASPERQPHDPVATSTRIAGLRSALTKAV
jgi:DNA helicase-2/ATP-dependent DNA helicase PcrA